MNQPDTEGQIDKITVIQWPTSKYCDSIYTRCTKIQRLMGLLKIDYQVADISLPEAELDEVISEKVNPLMRKIPIIKDTDGQYIEGTDKIVQYLLAQADATNLFMLRKTRQRAQNELLEYWIAHRLEWLVIYARWNRAKNYQRFIESFAQPKDFEAKKKSIDYTRKRALKILNTTDVGAFDEKKYFSEIEKSLDILNGILTAQEFFGGESVKESDLSVFMCVQALLDPSIVMERIYALKRKELCRWAFHVDNLTATSSTCPILEDA